MDDPYITPAARPPPAHGTLAPLQKPGEILALGILNLVFGGVGVFTKMISISSYILSEPAARPDSGWQSIGSLVISTVVVVLILIAGLKLVRGSRGALAASNRYAIASIIAKLISIPATIYGTDLPAFHNMNHTRAFTAYIVIVILITMIYPVLCLFLLNRRTAKEWFMIRDAA